VRLATPRHANTRRPRRPALRLPREAARAVPQRPANAVNLISKMKNTCSRPLIIYTPRTRCIKRAPADRPASLVTTTVVESPPQDVVCFTRAGGIAVAWYSCVSVCLSVCVSVCARKDKHQSRATVPQPTSNRQSRCIQGWTSSAINSRRSVVDCRPHLPRLPSPPVALNNRPTAVAVYIAQADRRRAVAKFSKSRVS